MLKILCTGNPNDNTLAKGIKEVFPEAEFIHLSAGYDLTTDEGLEKFRAKIRDYNVFINASRIGFGVQCTLLKIAREEWDTGHVFNIGSVLENDFFEWFSPEDAKDKKALRQLSLDLSSEHFKTTHIVTGGFTDRSPQAHWKMSPLNIARAIKWILESKDFYVPIIGVENDYWLKGQPGSTGDWHKDKARALKDLGRNYDLFRKSQGLD